MASINLQPQVTSELRLPGGAYISAQFPWPRMNQEEAIQLMTEQDAFDSAQSCSDGGCGCGCKEKKKGN